LVLGLELEGFFFFFFCKIEWLIVRCSIAQHRVLQ
jgi:hypothetical protein